MEIKNAADQDRAYKAEFPELPMQWKNYGYEITEKLGEGISGSVYKLVKNKGEADEEISALKMISWTLNKKMVYREYGNDWVKARRDFTQFFNDKVAHEVSRLESFAGAENIVQIKGSCLEKMPEFPIVKDTTPNMMNPRLYTTSYNKPQGQQFDTAVLSFIKLQYTEKSCKMKNIFVLVTILGHLPVILSAKRKGSDNMKHILIVEDDNLLNKTLTYNLELDGYTITSVLNARTAAESLKTNIFDLVLLDINLPDGNGYDLCRLIKPEHPDTVVIFLTANDQESDQIRGYEAGAVDYITKPFSISALQRKIKAMFAMLEHHKPAKDIYEDGSLFLDFSEQFASLNGKPLALSAMEYKMLNLFLKNPKQVLTRQQLLERLWDIDEKYVDEHTLTTSISRIRSKIEADGDTYIKTVYGMGYQWTGGEKK